MTASPGVGVGEADAAGAGPVGDLAHRALRRQLGVVEREQVGELFGRQAGDAEVHGCPPWCREDNGRGRGGNPPDFGTRFLRAVFAP